MGGTEHDGAATGLSGSQVGGGGDGSSVGVGEHDVAAPGLGGRQVGGGEGNILNLDCVNF